MAKESIWWYVPCPLMKTTRCATYSDKLKLSSILLRYILRSVTCDVNCGIVSRPLLRDPVLGNTDMVVFIWNALHTRPEFRNMVRYCKRAFRIVVEHRWERLPKKTQEIRVFDT